MVKSGSNPEFSLRNGRPGLCEPLAYFNDINPSSCFSDPRSASSVSLIPLIFAIAACYHFVNMAFLSWSLRSNNAATLDATSDKTESSAGFETENGSKLFHQIEPSPRHWRDDLDPKPRGVILVMGVSSPEKAHFVSQLRSNAVDQAEPLQSGKYITHKGHIRLTNQPLTTASTTTSSPPIQIIILPGFASNPDRDTYILCKFPTPSLTQLQKG